MHLSVFFSFKNHINLFPIACYAAFIGLDLESHSHYLLFFETRSRIIFLALTWRDKIEIIIWPFSYFETRTGFHFVTLMFRDEIETSENHFSWSSEKKWSWLSSRIPGIENSRWPLIYISLLSEWGKQKFWLCPGPGEKSVSLHLELLSSLWTDGRRQLGQLWGWSLVNIHCRQNFPLSSWWHLKWHRS